MLRKLESPRKSSRRRHDAFEASPTASSSTSLDVGNESNGNKKSASINGDRIVGSMGSIQGLSRRVSERRLENPPFKSTRSRRQTREPAHRTPKPLENGAGILGKDQSMKLRDLPLENITHYEAPSTHDTNRQMGVLVGTENTDKESAKEIGVEDTKSYMQNVNIHSDAPSVVEIPSDRRSQQTPHQGDEFTGNVSSVSIQREPSISFDKRRSLAQKIMLHAQKGTFTKKQAEVHIIGEIVSGRNFGPGCFSCKWSIDYGEGWTHLEGSQLDQTQIDCLSSSQASIIWAHPIDIHLTTLTMQGWPRILLQTWRIDASSKANVVGYGFIHVPMAPGSHTLEVSMWRPIGTFKTELVATCFGDTIELISDEILYDTAWTERSGLKTIATGKVKLRLDIILRNFDLFKTLF